MQRDKKSTGRNRVYTFELKWNVLPQVTFTLDNMENSTNIFVKLTTNDYGRSKQPTF